MTGRPGKWPWKNHSVAVTPLIPTIRFASGVVLDDPVDEQERPAMRDQRLDLAGRVEVAVDGASVTGGSWWVRVSLAVSRRARCGGLCAGAHHERAAAARKAALPTRSSRFVVIRPSRKVSLPSSARWIDDVGDRGRRRRARRAPTRPRAIAVARSGPQTIELAEQRVVERRHLVAGVQVRVHPDARAARRVVALDDARRRAGSRRSGSSALIRNSMAWPRTSTSAWLKPSGSPAAIRIWIATRSMPVSISVTGCSTWIRQLISMK